MSKKRFSQIWSNQTELGKRFGLSAIGIGRILTEYGLKNPQTGHATNEAIEKGLAKLTPLKNGTIHYMWHKSKIIDLIAKKYKPLSRVEFWVNYVQEICSDAEFCLKNGEDKIAGLMLDFLYDDVPKDIVAQVKARVESSKFGK